ncbi:MAG TPA: ABC transporter substrate-binding protein [Candidatus Acidoferrum sp.]|nr:ABC transporter substrate-binding protein [Candidatus Acidoferrum sp.]
MKPSDGVLSLLLTLALLAVPGLASGQPPAKVYRIGWLSGSDPLTPANPEGCPLAGGPKSSWRAWVEAMRERGYVQGQNLVVICRWTEAREERAPAFAAELVKLKVDLFVAQGVSQVRAAQQATSTIPIVMLGINDPVGKGLVASLPHPGGIVTGMSEDAGPEYLAKDLEFLTEAVPRASRVAALRRREGSPTPGWRRVMEALGTAARALGVTLQPYYVQEPGELQSAFAAMTKARAQALLVEPSWMFDNHARQIVDLAAQRRLPAMYPDLYWAEDEGGLMGYGVNSLDKRRHVAVYVDKIFKGAKPADLPVEQPTKLDLVINLKTAKALGLTVPPTLLIQADEVIR